MLTAAFPALTWQKEATELVGSESRRGFSLIEENVLVGCELRSRFWGPMRTDDP